MTFRGGALGIATDAGSGLTLAHTTATDNDAEDGGAFAHLSETGTDLTLTDSIVWRHTGSPAIAEGLPSPAALTQATCLFDANAGNYDLVTLTAPVDGASGNQIDSGMPDFVDVRIGDWAGSDWSLGPASDATGADSQGDDLGAFGGPDGAWSP